MIINNHNKIIYAARIKPFVTALLCITVFVLLLTRVKFVSEAVLSSLTMCVRSLVPSLLVMSTAVTFAAELGVCSTLGELMTPVTRRLWGMGGASGSVFILGTLSGYPIAGECAARLYKNGELTKSEAENLAIFANNAGPAFIIAAVGITMRSSLNDGVIIASAQLLSAIIIGMLLKKRKGTAESASSAAQIKPSPPSVSTALTHSIDSAARSMLRVTCAVTIFSVATAVMENIVLTTGIEISIMAEVVLFGLIEVTGGAMRAAQIEGTVGIAITAFLVTFSGLCVTAQTFTAVQGSGLNIKKYLPVKFVQALISASIAVIASNIFDIILVC